MIADLHYRPRHRCPQLSQRARLALLLGLFLSLLLGLTAGCATNSIPTLPPVTVKATGLESPGRFVWADLLTRDVPAAKSFYTALFGWTFTESGGYATVLREGTPIGGMLEPSNPAGRPEWVVNLSVADVDRAAALVREHNGTIDTGPVDAPARGRIALVSDSQGAILLLVRSSSGDPAEGDPAVGDWLWHELWTHDVADALSLYAAMGGTRADTVDFRDSEYNVLKSGEILRAGIVEAPPEVNPIWLPYVRVADVEAVVKRAEGLGARIVMQDERSAILVDPTGAAIGVGTSSSDHRRMQEGGQ